MTITRLALSTCLALGALVAGTTLASSQGTYSGFGQAEWTERFDQGQQGAPTAGIDGTEPMMNLATREAMEQALYAHEGLAALGGWGTVPTDKPLKLGVRDPNVVALRRRLIASGDLRQTAGDGPAFDSYVVDAVKRFQARHGLPADGVVGPSTLAALNIPVEQRVKQLRANLQRMKALGLDLGNRYVMVNVPAARIEVVENGVVRSRHTAVVGKTDRQTPLLSSRIHQINFNPYWTVPKSIIRKDLIPKMQTDPEYLTRNRIRIFNAAGTEIPPGNVDWHSDEAVRYMFKQDPGDENSLGSMRLNFHNPHSVFLHDTPSKGLFGSDYRFESSGCVRVQNIKDLVSWVLRDNGYDRAGVDHAIRRGERVDVDVANPPRLHLVYFTAWTTGDGVFHFRDDIYNMDGTSMPLVQEAAAVVQ